jgi:hypothetical protein
MRRTTIVLALGGLSQGCWRDGPATHATVDPVPATSADPSAPPAFTMTKAADALDLPPVEKVVIGTARTAKLAPAVILEDGTPVYCLGVDAWPATVDGTRVTATGMLQATAEFAGGLGEAGSGGAVWVLRGCTFSAL